MEHAAVNFIEESHLLIFLIQIALLLALARGFGMLLARFGQPSITAEVMVGVLLGPTILGRFWPEMHAMIFPPDAVQHVMLDTVAWLGILFFLLVTGMETDLTTAWRHRRDSVLIAMSDLLIPMAVAFLPAFFIPAGYLINPEGRLIFALFIATISTISALPITARAMQDLDVYKSDAGLVIMGALTVNDLAGWLVFAILLGIATGTGAGAGGFAFMAIGTLAFAVIVLTAGRVLSERAIAAFHRWRLPDPGATLTFVSVIGLIGGAATMWIGVHALLGFLLVGLAAGEARGLSEASRNSIAQTVRAVFVPLFFASIGLKIDFLAGFSPVLALFIFALGVGGRFLGAWVGARFSRQPRADRYLISVAHTPGGEMQIVVGMLALEYGILSNSVFVAIVFGSILSSITLGPWMKRAVKASTAAATKMPFSRELVQAELGAVTREEAIHTLAASAARAIGSAPNEVVEAVLERERTMGTGIGRGFAGPHARLPAAKGAVVAVGRSTAGIEWDAPDGEHVHLVFLIVSSAEDAGAQLQVLRSIGAIARSDEARATLMEARNDERLWYALRRALAVSTASDRRKGGHQAG